MVLNHYCLYRTFTFTEFLLDLENSIVYTHSKYWISIRKCVQIKKKYEA